MYRRHHSRRLTCHPSFPVCLLVHRKARNLFSRQIHQLHARRRLARMRLANLGRTSAIRDPRSREGHHGCLGQVTMSSKIRQNVTTATHSLLWTVSVPGPWECSWPETPSQSYMVSGLFPCPCLVLVEAQEVNCSSSTSKISPLPQGPQRPAALPYSHLFEHQASVPSSALQGSQNRTLSLAFLFPINRSSSS